MVWLLIVILALIAIYDTRVVINASGRKNTSELDKTMLARDALLGLILSTAGIILWGIYLSESNQRPF